MRPGNGYNRHVRPAESCVTEEDVIAENAWLGRVHHELGDANEVLKSTSAFPCLAWPTNRLTARRLIASRCTTSRLTSEELADDDGLEREREGVLVAVHFELRLDLWPAACRPDAGHPVVEAKDGGAGGFEFPVVRRRG